MELVREFRSRHVALLADRKKRQDLWDNGELPNFLAETWEIRKSDWKIAGIPEEILDRRVEITGPTDRKMVINALIRALMFLWQILKISFTNLGKRY